MCDFHNFGLIFAGQCTVCLKGKNQRFLNFFFRTERPWRGQQSEKIFQKALILFFVVIVQPPKTHFLTFSCETKIMKITYSGNVHEKNWFVVFFHEWKKIPRYLHKFKLQLYLYFSGSQELHVAQPVNPAFNKFNSLDRRALNKRQNSNGLLKLVTPTAGPESLPIGRKYLSIQQVLE